MKRSALILCAVIGTSLACAAAQKPAWQPAPGHITLPLWPNGAPGAPANPPAEIDTTKPTDNLIAGRPLVRLGNVSNPDADALRAKGQRYAAGCRCFPGGGYQILAIDLEGTEVCDWLNSINVACVLVKYRVPNTGPYPKSPAALQDAQRALGMVRQHAAEWHIDPNRVGVLGFSAGAHLAAALSTHFDKRLYDSVDAADQLSCRPDFAFIIYPGYLANAAENMAPNADINPTAQTPPTFIVQAENDPGARRKRDGLLPAIEGRQGSRRAAHLRGRRTRIRPAPHRAARDHLAGYREDLAADDQGASARPSGKSPARQTSWNATRNRSRILPCSSAYLPFPTVARRA